MATTRKTTTSKTTAAKQAAVTPGVDEVHEPADVDQEQTEDESLSATIVAEDKPAAKPAGSPQMVPLSAVGRRTRGEFQRTWMEPFPDEMIKQMTSADGAAQVDYASSAEMIRNSALIVAAQEDALRLVAFSTEAFDRWAEKVDDQQISDLFSWYQGRFGSGE